MANSKYKMICIDMDGTLLGEKHKISEYNKNILKEASKRGVKIVITTGRLYNNAAYYSELVGAKAAVIGGNGAIIREKNEKEPIYKSKLDREIVLELFRLAKKHNIILHMHTIEDILTNSHLSAFVGKLVLPCKEIPSFPINIKVIKSEEKLKKWLDNSGENITKCIAFRTTKSNLKKFKEEATKLKGVTSYISAEDSVEINEEGVSKGRAVETLAKRYGINRDEIICIGDNENDISMIEYAGLGIAMGNGIERLKEKADYITDTNINDGVGKAVKKFVLDDDN